MWLQLMCCTLLDFHCLNLQGVGLKDLRGQERLKLVEKSKSIFELMKYMKVPQIIYSRLWRGLGMLELQVSVKLSAAE